MKVLAILGLNPIYLSIYIYRYMYLKVLVAQLCLILCDPMDCSSPGSSAHRNSQARILEWVAISFSRDLLNPEIEPGSPAFQADALTSEPPCAPTL